MLEESEIELQAEVLAGRDSASTEIGESNTCWDSIKVKLIDVLDFLM